MSKSRISKTLLTALPEILMYGSGEIILQSSLKPQIKASTSSAIKILKEVAFQNKIVSLSANQIGLEERVFVAVREGLMKAGKWTDYEDIFEEKGVKSAEEGYQAVVGAVEVSSSYDSYYGFEECPSFPGFKFKIPIPLLTNIKYLPERAFLDFLSAQPKQSPSYEPPESLYVTQALVGFRGRVWDHEIRHLEGLLPIEQRLCKGEFYLLDDYKDSIENIQHYENVMDSYRQFEEKNLKKLEKEVKSKKKAREEAKAKGQTSSFANFNQIPERVNSVLKDEGIDIEKLKSMGMDKQKAMNFPKKSRSTKGVPESNQTKKGPKTGPK